MSSVTNSTTTPVQTQATTQPSESSARKGGPRPPKTRKPKPQQPIAGSAPETSVSAQSVPPSTSEPRIRPPRNRNPRPQPKRDAQPPSGSNTAPMASDQQPQSQPQPQPAVARPSKPKKNRNKPRLATASTPQTTEQAGQPSSQPSTQPVSANSPAFYPRTYKPPKKAKQPPAPPQNAAPVIIEADEKLLKEGYTQLAAQIITKLQKNSYDCMVCFEGIKRQQPIWACTHCYALFHKNCITKWSEKSALSTDSSWRCPGCNHKTQGVPTSSCYCGKTDGVRNQTEGGYGLGYLIPHSCGELCSKPRTGTDCPHTCSLICHPGPCPACPAIGPIKYCFCGKTAYRLRCGQADDGQSCDNPCDKILACGRHYCQRECHAGPCGDCMEVISQECFCGRHKEDRLCSLGEETDFGDDQDSQSDSDDDDDDDDEDDEAEAHRIKWKRVYYSCHSVCGRTLQCGNHTCQVKCHSGGCAECALLPSRVTTCPCGKTKQPTRKSCTDPVSTCSNTCDKNLPCGHRCASACHHGDCPPCSVAVQVTCRCGNNVFTAACSVAFPQPASPTQPKPHPKQFLCERVCTQLRSCGRHRCNTKCCPDTTSESHICPLICGKKLKCGTHKCDQLCHKGHCGRCFNTSFDERVCACGKTVQLPPIECGTPPLQCRHPCTKVRPCGHSDPLGGNHLCHDGPCPPCVMLVDKTCSGGHGVHKAVACYITEVSCGRICGVPLPCGQHTCSRHCHTGPCVPSMANAAPTSLSNSDDWMPTEHGRVSCGQPCGLPLSTCEHTCQSPCHPGQQCPNVLCKQITKIFCPCERLSKQVKCNKGGGAEDTLVAEALQCDDQCELEKRNKRLAEAFGISSAPGKPPVYSDLLINLGKATPQFIHKLEQAFINFVQTTNPKCSLPPMDRVQRQIVHELSKYYFFEATSFDREPNRYVVLTRSRDTKIPSVLLSSVIANYISKLPMSTTVSPYVNLSASPSSTPYAMPPRTFALHIYELDPSVKTQHLLSFLGPYRGEFQLQWIDDGNALAIFTDERKMRAALNSLSGGAFRVKIYKDHSEDVRTFTPPSNTFEKSAPPPLKPLLWKEDDSWREDNNMFAVLNGANTEHAAATTQQHRPPAQPALPSSTTVPTPTPTVVPAVSSDADWEAIADSDATGASSAPSPSTSDDAPPAAAPDQPKS